MSKIVKLNYKQMPNINTFTKEYQVRYRIVSEDGNVRSAFSPMYSVDPELIYQPGRIDSPGFLIVEQVGSSFISTTWDAVSVYKKVNEGLSLLDEISEYDIWIKWADSSAQNESEWIHKERISTTSLSINVPSTYPYVDPNTNNVSNLVPGYLYVEILRPSNPLMRYEETTSFNQDSTTIDISNSSLYFEEGNPFSTGSSVLYESSSAIGGLIDSTIYYIRVIDYFNISLYPTENDAKNNSNRITLSGTPSGVGSITGLPFRSYSGSIAIS
jgi:hypothetical protein